jgi:hypothetical protein
MRELLQAVSRWVRDSDVHDLVVMALSNVPGLPPIVQAVHIAAVCVVMGTIVFVNLRLLGLAVPSQEVSEMIGRLLPFTWWSLPFLVVSGGMFVFARPARYFFNPVFGIKVSLLIPALVLALTLHLLNRMQAGFWERSRPHLVWARLMSAVSVLLWLGVMLAGRWIAYADYLFWPAS